jgi:CrcB protein
VLGTGFCGAYTTFSTFTFQAVRLAGGGARGSAVRYVLATLAAGTAGAAAGLALGGM